MSITIDISDEKLREAEELLDIHDSTQLFLSLLEEKLAGHAAQRRDAGMVNQSFDFDAALAAAAALPDLSDQEFARFAEEMNRPLPPVW